MAKRTIRDIDIAGKRLLVRVDFNVPQHEDGSIANDGRIRAALPTLEYCLAQNASLVLMSHLGRPGNGRDAKLSLRGVAKRLGKLLDNTTVRFAEDVGGEDALHKVGDLKPGEVLLLENLRFDPGEQGKDEDFARRLREFGEIYVNDAFAACHRKDTSMYAVPKLFPEGKRVLGLLVERELSALDGILESPKQPLVAILGGAKVADKIGVIEALLDRVEKLLIGGAMAYTFMRAQGLGVGASKVEEDKVDLARRLLDRGGDKIVLPEDHMVRQKSEASAKPKVVDKEIPDGCAGLDIGPKTIQRYREVIRNAATVVWNGPLGKFEEEPFDQGTEAILRALAESEAVTVVGGGESSEVVEQLDLVERLDHVSTGGGAFLEYLEKSTLPALTVIEERA